MKKAWVFVDDIFAGELMEIQRGRQYRFVYDPLYRGGPVSLTMPTTLKVYDYDHFPPFFEGVLPEGVMLEGLLRRTKIDRDDLLTQLITVGGDLVGNVTVKGAE